MKKILLVLTGLIAFAITHAQSLDEIVKSYSAAMKQDKLSKVSSIKITGKMSSMGMEMPMVMMMKNPDKMKIIYSFNGQDIVSVFDGEKGYTINPMMGSSSPVELTGDQLKQVQKSNAFTNQLDNYFKNGQLTLEGQENVNGKPAYKLKADGGSSPIYLFLDKGSYMLVKTTSTINQMGTSSNIDSFMTDYVEIEGVVMPKKITTMTNGMEAAVINFEKIEVNIPMDDGVFKIK